MFDLSRLGDTLSGIAGYAGPASVPDVATILHHAGLDPAVLEGLAPDQIRAVLTDHGFDPTQFDLTALANLGDMPTGVLGALRDTMGLRDL
jgi:hypothetical protein